MQSSNAPPGFLKLKETQTKTLDKLLNFSGEVGEGGVG